MNKLLVFALATLVVISNATMVEAAEPQPLAVWAGTSPSADVTVRLTGDNLKILAPATLELSGVVVGEANVKPAPATLKGLAEQMVTERFGKGHFKAFDAIVTKESNWNPKAVNRSSGACGLPQALPCAKIKDQSPTGQLEWMIDYIDNRYGTPNKAWNFWLQHRWY
jgi:hypothetical protein